MPKRKRSEEEELTKILSASHHAIHHALKIAKGYERQRQSKRLRDPDTDAEKRARLQNEIVIQKSLDLHQVALTHLRAALLRVKPIAECDKLPEEVKAPVQKPDVTEEEAKALHNVTSNLCARVEVRKATDKAIEDVGKALGVKVPEKKKGRVRKKDFEKETEEVVADKEPEKDEEMVTEEREKPERKSEDNKRKLEPASNGANEDSESDEEELPVKEEVVAKMEDILGSSSEAESDDDGADWAAITAKVKAQLKGATFAKDGLDPMEVTSGEEEEDDDMEYDLDSEGGSEDNEVSENEAQSDSERASESGSFNGFSDNASEQSASDAESGSDSESSADRSPPRKKKAAPSTGRPGESAFIPSLMAGYISDSNSEASDLDIAPNSRKNRRGQRARQAIWEKKFKEQAKHLREGGNKANKRDDGWDMKRGAVDPDSAGKPWKSGIKNPLLEKDGKKEEIQGQGEEVNYGGRTLLKDRKKGGMHVTDRPLNRKERRALGIKEPVGPPGGGNGGGSKPAAGMPPKKRDDEGPLHPSWEARKKAKEKLETAPFQGKKITFD
ncbi:Bud-site selection protein [Rhypophila decipiens]|uniref:Bud-site selection protein n=1 Tax=Rhypophila decipiens TaxID=261697 RepID=A0AAN7BDN3_9PEZI|nr:Bud-site selection protein [Rhypophila decipiens]